VLVHLHDERHDGVQLQPDDGHVQVRNDQGRLRLHVHERRRRMHGHDSGLLRLHDGVPEGRLHLLLDDGGHALLLWHDVNAWPDQVN
jgi:hypothetical protein